MQHERYTYKATWLVWKKDFKKGLFFILIMRLSLIMGTNLTQISLKYLGHESTFCIVVKCPVNIIRIKTYFIDVTVFIFF